MSMSDTPSPSANPPVDGETLAHFSEGDSRSGDPLAEVQAELAELKAKSADLADQFLRAKAEAENARRRAEDEISKARKFAVESFAESLLPVTDSLEAGLAVQNATTASRWDVVEKAAGQKEPPARASKAEDPRALPDELLPVDSFPLAALPDAKLPAVWRNAEALGVLDQEAGAGAFASLGPDAARERYTRYLALLDADSADATTRLSLHRQYVCGLAGR